MLRLLALFLLLCLAAPAAAQEALFSSEVGVDITGTDAAAARASGIAQAKREGFGLLLDKLAPEQKGKILKSLDEAKILSLVRSAEVLEEKTEGTRWRARVKVTYDALPISGLLAERVSKEGIPENAERSLSVLVLPLYEEAGNQSLFEPENPWAEAWKQVSVARPGGMLVTPYADNIDAAVLAPKAAETADFKTFAPLIARYGSGMVIVAKAIYSEDPLPHIRVTRRLVTRRRDESAATEYVAETGEAKADFLRRAAYDMAQQLARVQNDRAERRARTEAGDARLHILVPIRRMENWLKLRAKLEALPAVARVDMLAMAPQQVEAELYYKGDAKALAQSLAARSVKIKQTPSYWILSDE